MIKISSSYVKCGKVEIDKSLGNIRTYYEVDPHEALEELERQAPEVLRKWVRQRTNDLSGTVEFLNLCPFNNIFDVNDCVYMEEGYCQELECCGENSDAKCFQLMEDKSPWIPVSEQEPPKDGSEILVREGDEVPYKHFIFKWKKEWNCWIDVHRGNIWGKFSDGDEWMPIPE